MENKNSPLAGRGVMSQDTAGTEDPNLQKRIVRDDLLPKNGCNVPNQSNNGGLLWYRKSLGLKVNNKYMNNIPGFSNPASIIKGIVVVSI